MTTSVLEKSLSYDDLIASLRLIDDDFMRIIFKNQDCIQLLFVNVNINFTKNVSLSFTSFGCFAHLPLSLISCLLFYRTFL